jgi:hypothetical protein
MAGYQERFEEHNVIDIRGRSGKTLDEEGQQGGPVHVAEVVLRVMADLARRRIDPEYLGEHH